MKTAIYKIICLNLIIFFTLTQGLAQEQIAENSQSDSKGLIWSVLHGLEYRLKAGFNIGGTSPLPLPSEIREINSYTPTLAISIEGDIVKWINPKWGAMLGIRFENKGMSTDARVKNYHMVMDARNDDGTMSHMEGAWTGHVTTKVRNSYITLPLTAIYKISKRWELKAGPYASFLINGNFDGTAYDGYIRDGNPTGEKIMVTEAIYDFSDDLRKVNWGVDVGAEWKAYKHLNIYTDIAWGLSPVFKKDFKSITFNMYNIYANFGFGYVF